MVSADEVRDQLDEPDPIHNQVVGEVPEHQEDGLSASPTPLNLRGYGPDLGAETGESRDSDGMRLESGPSREAEKAA